MDILIKNMEMPTNCFTCIFSELNDNGILVCIRLGKACTRSKVRPDCPIVELPPHGRLIDADKVIKSLKKQAMAYWRNNPRYQIVMDVLDSIKNAPTVLEATE